jgi:hypothetical protein
LNGYGAQVNVPLWGQKGPDLAARAMAAGREDRSGQWRAAHTAHIWRRRMRGRRAALADGACVIGGGVPMIWRPEKAIRPRSPIRCTGGSRPTLALLTHAVQRLHPHLGGYAEASELQRLAGEDCTLSSPTGGRPQHAEVYAAPRAYIRATVARYERWRP